MIYEVSVHSHFVKTTVLQQDSYPLSSSEFMSVLLDLEPADVSPAPARWWARPALPGGPTVPLPLAHSTRSTRDSPSCGRGASGEPEAERGRSQLLPSSMCERHGFSRSDSCPSDHSTGSRCELGTKGLAGGVSTKCRPFLGSPRYGHCWVWGSGFASPKGSVLPPLLPPSLLRVGFGQQLAAQGLPDLHPLHQGPAAPGPAMHRGFPAWAWLLQCGPPRQLIPQQAPPFGGPGCSLQGHWSVMPILKYRITESLPCGLFLTVRNHASYIYGNLTLSRAVEKRHSPNLNPDLERPSSDPHRALGTLGLCLCRPLAQGSLQAPFLDTLTHPSGASADTTRPVSPPRWVCFSSSWAAPRQLGHLTPHPGPEALRAGTASPSPVVPAHSQCRKGSGSPSHCSPLPLDRVPRVSGPVSPSAPPKISSALPKLFPCLSLRPPEHQLSTA